MDRKFITVFTVPNLCIQFQTPSQGQSYNIPMFPLDYSGMPGIIEMNTLTCFLEV
jgi:hypothetical protein